VAKLTGQMPLLSPKTSQDDRARDSTRSSSQLENTGNMYLEVKAFGVIKTSCGDEWLAGDASVACCTDDDRL